MAQNRFSVNCLVQVDTDNRLDVVEWLDYHVALGFDTIFVFDTAERKWLDAECEKRKAHVELVPRSEDWQYKSEIIRQYSARRELEEWCVCMDTTEFLWISPERAKSVIQFAEQIPPNIAAVTVYTKHLSSKEPMRYRVGTQMDCFTHSRREPEGFLPEYAGLPNAAITFLRIVDHNMPMRDRFVPLYTNAWVDSEFRQMTPARFEAETGPARKLFPSRYSVRCYKYGIRSGAEMGFDDKMVPVGFDIVDLTMQKARERFMHVPVNPDTEKLFAKTENPEKDTVKVDVGNGATMDVSPEAAAELSLPVTRARVDKLIFKGQFFEDIAEYVEKKDPNYDRAALERVFEQERQKIIQSSPIYTELQELVDQGKDDNEILRTLVLKSTTLEMMKRALPVLGIVTEYASPETITESNVTVEVGPAEGVDPEMAGLSGEFDKQIEINAPTPEELAAREEAVKLLDEKAAKKRSPSKSKGKKKPVDVKKPAKKVKVVAAKQVGEAAAAPKTASATPEQEELPGLNEISDGMEVDMDAVLGNIQGGAHEKGV